MTEIISYIVVIGACAYVAMPLFSKNVQTHSAGSEVDSRVGELLNQQLMATSTIDDLEFDLQTGKLSQEDYESLVADQRKIQKDADARLKDISGVSSTELIEKLELDIAEERKKLAPNSTPTCPACNKPIKTDDKFCSECGAKL
jgi:hypothetical protein